METYVILGNFTKQGVDTLKDLESRIADSKAAVEKAGGQWIGYWMTMGKYDFVVVTTSPDATEGHKSVPTIARENEAPAC